MNDTRTRQDYLPPMHYHFLTPAYDFLCLFGGFNRRFRENVMRQTDVPKDGKVLDVGCGTGILTRMMKHKEPSATIMGLDPDERVLDIARRKSGDPIEYICGGGENMPFPDAHFDMVTSTLALHHIKDKAPVFKEIRRVLKPGGVFVLTDFGKPDHPWSILSFLAKHYENGAENVDGKVPDMLVAAGFNDIRFGKRPKRHIDLIFAK